MNLFSDNTQITVLSLLSTLFKVQHCVSWYMKEFIATQDADREMKEENKIDNI